MKCALSCRLAALQHIPCLHSASDGYSASLQHQLIDFVCCSYFLYNSDHVMRLLPCSYHEPRQGRAAIHVHRGFPCRPEHTWQVAVSGRSRNTGTHVANPAGQLKLIKLCMYCKLTSLDAIQVHPRHYKSPQPYPERNG